MDKEIKKQKNNTVLKVFLGAAALSTVLYFGNAFNIKNYVNQGISHAKDAVVDVFTTDVGELSTKLYNKVEETEDISQYKGDIQQTIYAINDRFSPESQFDTIDGLIERTSPNTQQKIISVTYSRQDPNFKAKFTEQNFNDIPYERRVEIGKKIAEDIFEDNKSDVMKNIDELKENFIELYRGFLNKFKGK